MVLLLFENFLIIKISIMKHARRLLFNLNVSPQKLKNLFSVMGLTFCCIFTAYSQNPCDPNPFNVDTPVATEVLDGQFDFTSGCTSTPTVEAGGEYQVTLAANTTYEFTVCENSNGDFPNVEFWSDQSTFVESFAVAANGNCVEYTFNSCEAGPIFLVVYEHDCIGSWADFTLITSCTTCTITCSKQTEALSMEDCDITGLQLDDPVITGSCFELDDLSYVIDENDDGVFDEMAVAYGTAVNGLNPGCYNVKWFFVDMNCPVESASCQLCVNSVHLTCKGGTRQYTSTLNCSTEIKIEDVIKNTICENTMGADCFVYEISIDGVNWFDDAIPIAALGTYDVTLRVCYYEDCTDQSSAEFCSMLSCFTAVVVNNSAPMCMLGDKSTVNFCGITIPSDAPMFLACGTDPVPTAEDNILGECGIFTVGGMDIDLNALTDTDGDGFADQLQPDRNVLIPADYPGAPVAGTCDFDVLHIIERTWTATADNGVSSSCSEYIFVLAPDISCVMVEPYEAECTGDGSDDLSAATLAAIDIRFAPYYTLPDGVTNVSLVGQHDNCKISLGQKEDTPTAFSCPVKSKFLRKWHVIDWCNSSDPILLTQLVKTLDTTPPTFDDGACPGDIEEGGKDNEIVLTIMSNCSITEDLSVYNPAATDLCCDVDDFTIEVFSGTEAEVESGGGTLETGEGTMFALTKGFYRADFTVADACGNISVVCSKYFDVRDGVTPSAHCDAPTIDLDSNQEAMLCADVIGAGSTDNCSVALLEIGLMPLDGSDPTFVAGCVTVTCDFVNGATSSVMVVIRATDGCGLTSISMCEAIVKDVISIECGALTDPLNVNCNDYTTDTQIGPLPILSTTCDMPTAEIMISDGALMNDNGCSTGTVLRTYTVFVDGVASNTSCTQTLNITEPAIDVPCPTQPTPIDCDIDNFPWVDPMLNNGDMLCDDNVMIVARTPDVEDRTNFPTIMVTRTWDITRACDSFMSTCESTVSFEDCCPDAPAENIIRIGSFRNPNQILLAEVPGQTVDWSLYTFEIYTGHNAADETPTISNTIMSNLSDGPVWNVQGGSISAGVQRTYFVRFWVGGVDDRPIAECMESFLVLGPESTGETSRVAGKIVNEENDVIEEVMVDLQNSIEPVDMTGTDGVYDFPEVLTGQNYSVVPTKDNDPLNGVSTYDLVLISQHIIGQNLLSSPYKMIAADVNNDGQITTFDIVQLRQLILFAITDFSANTSWRFIDEAYVFSDPSNPWSQTFPEQYDIANLDADMNINFVAVKVGDVNCSARASNLQESHSRDGGNEIILSAHDELLKEGETKSILVEMSETSSINSIQFTFGFDPSIVNIKNVKALNENLGEQHFGMNMVSEGAITFGWHSVESTNLEGNLFEVEIEAKRNLFLKDVFTVNSDFTQAVAYNADGEESNVSLIFDNEVIEPLEFNAFKLDQNKPNPFTNETVIGFEIPSDSKATLTVFNLDGKVLVQQEKFYQAGQNQITISKKDLNASGVLYYQLDTAFGSATRKMIVINN